MINIITKNQYYKNISTSLKYSKYYKHLKFISVQKEVTESDAFLKIIEKCKVVYLEVNGIYISYLTSVEYILIPEIYDFNNVIDILSKDRFEVTFNNWKLERLGYKPKHIINAFVLVCHRTPLILTLPYNDNSGNWRLINTETLEVIPLELLYLDDSWWCTTEFDGRTVNLMITDSVDNLPIDGNKLHKEYNYIDLLINGCKNY